MNEITVPDLDGSIEYYRHAGFRLDMIKPADEPREALMSRDTERVKLVRGPKTDKAASSGKNGEWVRGRAGMEYRDLIAGRMDGRVIASHIRLTQGGEVADYVHYHSIEFQIIFCRKGRIKVVYEGQGDPFWLETGDCVLQPPEIRHRVLECTAGAEVIEVSLPAEHETWVEHDMKLPDGPADPARMFGSQRFVRSVAAHSKWTRQPDNIEVRDIGIFAASGGIADVRVFRLTDDRTGSSADGTPRADEDRFTFALGPRETLVLDLLS